jgi:hypothetical protein
MNILVTRVMNRAYRSCGDPHPVSVASACGMLGSKSVGHRSTVWLMVSLVGLSKNSPLHRFRMQCPLPGLKYRGDHAGRFAANELVVR